MAHNKFSVLLLESLVPLAKLIGHEFVLIPLLLTGVQLFGQNQKSLLLALQLSLTNDKLQEKCFITKHYTDSGE